MLRDEEVERALVVCAHPDDVDFGAAGTVAGWTDAGVEVSYCLVSDGDAGGFDPSVPRSEIGAIRRGEQTAAAKEVGVTDLHWLGFPDGYLTVTLELRKAIARVIRQVRPQRVLTQSPQRNYQRVFASHPDHLATGEATLCAVYPDSRNEFWMPDLVAEEGLAPWSVSEVWLMACPRSTGSSTSPPRSTARWRRSAGTCRSTPTDPRSRSGCACGSAPAPRRPASPAAPTPRRSR